MTNQQNSNPNGGLKDEMTDTQQATQSFSAASPSILDTSDSTALLSPSFQPTPNSEIETPNLAYSRIVQAFAAKLGALVFWRRIKLGDGQEVYALCFPVRKWEVDPVSKELKPNG